MSINFVYILYNWIYYFVNHFIYYVIYKFQSTTIIYNISFFILFMFNDDRILSFILT